MPAPRCIQVGSLFVIGLAAGAKFVAVAAASGRAKSTDKAFASDWTMAWTVKAGKVTSFRSFEDTHVVAAAFSA